MISTLRELIAPFTESEFSDLLRRRTPAFRRASDATRFTGLLDWDTLRGTIESGAFPAEKLRITQARRPLLAPVHLAMGKLNVTNFAKLLEAGVSVVVEPLAPYVPALKILCTDLEARIGEDLTTSGIMTTGGGGAFNLHFDRADLIVLQIEGSKRWKVCGPPVAGAVKGVPEPAPPEQPVPLFDDVLRPGDFFFVPAGYWHVCENGPERSLHVSIGFNPRVGAHAVRALVRLLYAEEIFRLPLMRFGDAAQTAAHEAAVKARLIEKIEQMSLSDMLAEGAKIEAEKNPVGQ